MLYGGAGSGKSWHVAQKLIRRCVEEPGHRFLVIRKVYRTCRVSTYQLFKEVVRFYDIPDVKFLDGALTIRIGASEIIHAGVDDVEKLKSIAGITGIWIEEATELEAGDFEQIDLRLRGITHAYKQVAVTFNPISHLHWLKRFFFDQPGNKNPFIVHTTYKDNPYAGEEYEAVLEGLEDEQRRKVYLEGLWGQLLEQIIYTNWSTVPVVHESDDVLFGLDFGYNVPTALVELHRREKTIGVRELLYQTHLSNAELIEVLKDIIPEDMRSVPMICDIEPDRIKELKWAGFNAKPAKKSAGPLIKTVNKGIDAVKAYHLEIEEGSENVIGELYDYSWMVDKDGVIEEKPIKVRDHLMDAIRYPVYTVWGLPEHRRKPQGSNVNI